MEITVLCAVVACLSVLPSRSQFFKYESVTLSCGGNSTEWRVRRNTSKNIHGHCPSYSNERNNSTCFIDNLYELDSGVYWCESEAGERSNEVNITVTAGSLILESPEHPVSEGDEVNLHCRAEKSFSNLTRFYRNGVLIGNSSTGTFNIQSVSKSDEGLYKCNVSGVGESPESWLAVRERSPKTPTAPLAHILLPVVVCFLLLIMLMLHCLWRNHKGRLDRSVSYTDVTISMEMIPQRTSYVCDESTFYSTLQPVRC
ncbi:Fc receptor-like protein 5 [Cyprinodon tularosa]|uniref:Fc receptor-like protein 5 n=1 Tax=Cyprinodon tularosa TaxID=77115 RepID=UPI0018E28A73|nr:Fc receptor-like protein 5 [Cyprinodon tularosa]